MRFVAFDYGVKRVGIAASDGDGKWAFPVRTLDRTLKSAFYAELADLLGEIAPGAAVVGLPLHADGAECVTTRQARNFADSLARRYPFPIYMVNEYLTSVQAEEELRSAGVRGRRIKTFLDSQAAVLILETFLAMPERERQKCLRTGFVYGAKHAAGTDDIENEAP
ncbi:MAG: Holliday junction resolvase RuvX [Mailhella sp.]|nr:Holliday junction resolvase RuvX [Mailhella sp.]